MTRLSLAFAALTALTGIIEPGSHFPVQAGNWPQWRGPANTGVAGQAAPTTWSDSSNVAWKVEIPGRGFSTPAVWGDRIFLTTAMPTGKPAPAPADTDAAPRRRGRQAPPPAEHRFIVMALDRATGKVLWEKTATVATPHEGYHHLYGSFASNSPVTDGERVYASFGSRGLYVYDMNGNELWTKDYGVELTMRLQFGEGAAPVLEDGRLIMLMDHNGESFLSVLDAASGKEMWRVARDGSNNWSTPAVFTHNGRKQIVVSAPAAVHAYDFQTGASIWSATGLGHNTIPQPVKHDDLVWVMSGYRNPMGMAIRLGGEGDLTGTDRIVWTQDRGMSYTATPVIHDGVLYTITDTAMVSAFDIENGKPLYHQVRLPRPYNIKASPVVAGGHIYFATEEGDVIVAKTGPELEIVATNTLKDQSFIASPVMPGGEIFLRSRTHLFKIAD
jgi:outer membrane protein assembly factor BamB